MRSGETIVVLFSVTVSLTLLLFGSSYGSEDSKVRYEVGSSPYNVSDKAWVAKWWQWYVSVPKTHSPNNLGYPNHITNQTCSVYQNASSPVFFLFSPYVEEKVADRTCIVPKGKAILIPIVSGEMDTGDPTVADTSDKTLKEIATGGNDNAAILTKLDGATLDFNHDPKYRILTDFFNINLPPHNLWEEKEKPGTYKGVAEGYYLFLKPLATGNHTLYYEAGTSDPNPNQYDQTVTYHLIVK